MVGWVVKHRMDDQQKIQALMIYFQHWGKEQHRAFQTAQGAHATTQIVCNLFPNIIETFTSSYGSNYPIPHWFWHELTHDLLHSLGGIPDDSLLLWTRSPHRRAAHHLGLDINTVWAQQMPDYQVRQVDAIVALF